MMEVLRSTTKKICPAQYNLRTQGVFFFSFHRTALSQLSVLLLGFMMTHIPVAPMFNGAWLKY